MSNRITSHLRGNAVAYVALFAALGGTSYAAARLAPGSVTSRALANGAVTHAKLAVHSIGPANFKPGALQSALGGKGGAGGKGAAGSAGPVGPQGAAGHDGSASVALRARGTGGVSAPHGAATTIPLTGGGWTQAANDVNLLTGSATMTIPQSCTGSFGNALAISVDGIPNTFAVAPTAPAGATVTVPLVVSEVMEPGADTQHTVTAKLQNSCTKSGEDYSVSDLKLDVVNFH
jgi:hypothetical protein